MSNRKIYLTIEIDAEDKALNFLNKVKKFNIGTLLTKNRFSIITHSNQDKLDLIVREICNESGDLIIGYACYNAEEVIYINEELEKNGLSISKVFIPSQSRLELQKIVAKNNAELHGRWINTSPEEVEISYQESEKRYVEMKALFSKRHLFLEEV